MIDTLGYHIGGMWRIIVHHWLTAVLVLLLAYFGFHAVHGDRGLYAWLDYNRALEIKRQELSELEARRAQLENRVDAMQPNRVDPDLLEEELLKRGYVKDDEVVILAPSE